ncbi:MFS transporter [Rickettsiales bacterium LUAb2]
MSPSYVQKSTIIGWSMWFIAALFYALDYFQHTAPSVLIKPIADSLSVNIVHVGNIMSIYFPIYALSQIPAGYIIDRFGLKYSLTFACIITSIGLVIMTIPSDFMLILGRVLIAVGSAFAFIGALKTADYWLPKSVFPIAVGITNTIGVLGGILGQPMLQKLIQIYEWQTAVLYIGIAGFILSGLIFALLYTPKEVQQKIKTTKVTVSNTGISIFKNKNMYILGLYSGIMVGTVVNAFSELYNVIFLEKTFHVNAQSAALISSMLFIGIAIGGPTHGIIARILKSAKKWMIISCLFTILSFASIIVLSGFNSNINLLYISYILSGFFVSSMLLSFSLATTGYTKEDHAKIFAVINMMIGVCGFIFQFALGYMIKKMENIFGTNSESLVFISSFMILLVPLIFSLFLCFKVKEENQ